MRNPIHRGACFIIPSSLPPLSLFIFLHYLIVPISGYSRPENFAINCGASGTPPDGSRGRNWTGDIGSEYSPSEKEKLSAAYSLVGQPSEGVPYSTARVSRHEFTYSFPLTAGQKYIRFHFYPSSYGKFNRSTAFFSVTTGNGFTLLKNFSAALAADYLKKQKIVREFCIHFNNEDREELNITFSPSAGADTYAFVNGIEVVSMPDYLYYTKPEDVGFQFIGQKNSFHIGTEIALENLYRLNVGGNSISSMDDTGMFRSWDMDNDYCVKLASVPANITSDLKFTVIPNYTAPEEVYTTARTMGNNKTENMGYNLTWFLPVDSGFSYMLRLHFCEFQPEIKLQYDREFTILIANETAERHADVITWSGGNGIPIYRDYGVQMPASQGSNKTQNLYTQLHPNPNDRTIYNDAILNGIELFKLSDAKNNLAGPNADPVESPSPPPAAQPTPSKGNKTKVIAFAGSLLVALIVLSLIAIFIVWRRRVRDSNTSYGGSWWGQSSYTSMKSTKTSRSSLPSDLCRHFTLQEIKAATNNFDNVLIVGVGGFGNVYKGLIKGGTTPVAIKRLNPESQQGAHEFKTEIEMLSQLRHLHLVSLIGYCNDNREMILVYDYMAHGTLRDHLYKTENPPLAWKQKLEICIGAARGLHYLHTGVKRTIIHRDVKTTNILLDEKWVAKVSDFGLSKVGPTSMSNAHVSTVVKGSFGYLDPEYYRRQQLTEKSDLYSFGVVLFEVLCARPPLDHTAEKERVSLAQWALSCSKNGKLEQIVDPFLKDKIAPDCLQKFAEIAVSCLHDQGIERPSMSDAVWGLQFAMRLQKSAEQEIDESESWRKEDEEDETPLRSGDDVFIFSSTESRGIAWDSKNSGILTTMMTSSGEENSSMVRSK